MNRALDDLEREIHRRTVAAGDEIGHMLANYAKTHHPWTPRTGATDVSTQGGVYEQTREYVRVVLSAGMSYNVFLELARSGEWAWLYPTVQANQQNIMRILERHLAL